MIPNKKVYSIFYLFEIKIPLCTANKLSAIFIQWNDISRG